MMIIRYRINVLEELQSNGYTKEKLIDENIISADLIEKIENGVVVPDSCIYKICDILRLEYIEVLECVPA